MFNGEGKADRRLLPRRESELPGQLAELILLVSLGTRLAQLHLDVAVTRGRYLVFHRQANGPVAVVLHGDLVGDLDAASATDDGLGGAPAAQHPFHPDAVVNAEVQLELLPWRDRAEVGGADVLRIVEDARRAWQ